MQNYPDGMRVAVVIPEPTVPVWQTAAVRALKSVPGVEVTWVVLPPKNARQPARRRRGVPALASAPVQTIKDPSALSRLGADRVLELDGRTIASPVPLWQFQFGLAPDAARLALSEFSRGIAVVEVAFGPPGRAARRGAFGVIPHSLRKTRERILTAIADWPRLTLAVPPSQAQDAPAFTKKTEHPARLYGGMVLHWISGTGRTILRKMLCEEWHVAVLSRPVSDWLGPHPPRPERGDFLPNPVPRVFLADPCVLPTTDDEAEVMVEVYDYHVGRGHIAVVSPARPDPVPALAPPHHLSYPFVFADRDALYCVPESYQDGRVSLYQLKNDRWERVATLIEGVAAVDSTCFRLGPWWWLLAGDRREDPDGRLFAWYAPNLLGPYRPHPLNPIKVDPRSSRPAGAPFWHQGHLYRPAQDCSRDYGGALAINRVVELTPERFVEETAAVVAPDPRGPYRHGIHTINGNGRFTVVDAKCYRFDLRYLGLQFRRRLALAAPKTSHADGGHGKHHRRGFTAEDAVD